jgi:uncharacterized protein YigE (DUF2233 family)
MNIKIAAIYSLFLSTWLVATYDTLAPGVYYKQWITSNPSQSIHILVVDPHTATIKIGVADNKCASARKTSEIAKGHNAVAAINGGFFDFGCKNKIQDAITKILDCLGYSKYKAFPVYTLQANNNYYSLSHNFTGAIAWNNDDQQPVFSAIKTGITLTINGKEYLVHELNKPHPKKPTLYSATYDKKSPALSESMTEIVIQDNQIKRIYSSSRGRKKIPNNGWVYVLPKTYKDTIVALKEGDPVSIQITHTQKTDLPVHIANNQWHMMDNILSSTPLLLYNGTIPIQLARYSSEFYTKRHPRTAFGVLNNNKWVFVVIDGRQKQSAGFTILELAQFMQKLGCTNALNFDGGSSSTMVINNTVVNCPSGREHCLIRKERPISNAIIILNKETRII